MLTLEGTGLVLIDFGISRLQDDVERSVTRTGQIVGTPEYLSPEIPTQRPDASEMERSLGLIADPLNAPPMRDIARQWLTGLQAPDATQTSMPMSG